MAKDGARDAYVGVLGFLSEDAQAALLRYLPHLEKCVDNEVAMFGSKLKAELLDRVSSASGALDVCLDRLGKQATSTELPSGGLGAMTEKVGGVVADLERAAKENEVLLRRVEALGRRMAEFWERRTTDGLRWAFSDLSESHERWWSALSSDGGTGESPLVVPLKDLGGKLGELEGALAGEGAPSGPAVEADREPATEKGPDQCLRELATLVWGLVGTVQAEQIKQISGLADPVNVLREQARGLTEWEDAVDRLRRDAKGAKAAVGAKTEDLAAALVNVIEAAHLDLLGGGALAGNSSEPARLGGEVASGADVGREGSAS